MSSDNKSNPLQGGPSGHLPLTIVIEGREYSCTKQFMMGRELRSMASLPETADLYLGLVDPWDDERVNLDDHIDLAREGVESFYVRHSLPLVIGGHEFHWKKQYITGAELRKLAKLSAGDEIYLQLQKPYEDEAVEDKMLINLARPGIELFRVKKKEEEICVFIHINDNPYRVKMGQHNVADLKKLGKVPLSDQLSQLVKGKLIPLQDASAVGVNGDEEFFSCKREGSSS